MKDKQGKHDHKLTKLLKFGLFATLMVAPLFAVLFKCMYVTFNKNAYQSYSGTSTNQIQYKYETNEVNSNADIKTSKIYTYELPYMEVSLTSVGSIELIKQNRENQESLIQTFNNETVSAYILTNNGRLEWYINLLNSGGTIRLDATKPTQLVFTNFTNSFSNIISYENVRETNNEDNIIESVNTINDGTLDNAFYYSVDEMQNNSLFNWTTSTAIYTPIDAMTSGLGITTEAVAILLTYWLYLTLIYIVIDIVVELFTWMTHTLLGKPL